MNRKGFQYLSSSHFLSPSLYHSILQECIYSFHIKYQNIHLYLFHTKPHIHQVFVEQLLGIILFMRYLCDNYEPLYIWIWNSTQKKYFPNKTFHVDNVNSGMTLFENKHSNGKILIWRHQEIYKVLIHELLHAFHISNHEAQTEFLAIVLYTYILSIQTKRSHKNLLIQELHYNERLCNTLHTYNLGNTNLKYYIFQRKNKLKKYLKKTYGYQEKHHTKHKIVSNIFSFTSLTLNPMNMLYKYFS